jgi:GWxTD domain-containing protein
MRARFCLLLLAVFVVAAAPPISAVPVDMGTPGSIGSLLFAADVVVVPEVGGGTIHVTYAVTHRELVFLRSAPEGYRARYEVTVILYDADGRQVAGDSWERAVSVASYEETASRGEAAREVLELFAAPGKYRLKIELKSLDARAEGAIQRAVEVPKIVPGALTLGTLLFERTEATAAGGDSVFVENPAREYGEDHPTVRLVVPVYGDPGPAYRLALTVETEDGIVHKSIVDTVAQSAFATQHLIDFPVLDLEVGSYVARVKLRLLGGSGDISAAARFRVVTSPRSWGEDFEKMLAQVSYVATRDEVEALRNAAPEERDAAWAAFWKGCDPDPATEENEVKTEFLRRLGYANTKFRSSIEGWQTDMGRIYIQHGEPDDIDSQPIGQSLNAWETWYYYNEHTKYVFVDNEGFGEFRLIETSRI